MDELGIERAHVMGGCIGVAYVLRIAHDAPGRISAGVCQDPVGLDETNSIDVFTAMFKPTLELARAKGVEGVVASAMENSMFMANNAGGPFARRLAADSGFRQEIVAMGSEGYIALLEAFFAVPEAVTTVSLRQCWPCSLSWPSRSSAACISSWAHVERFSTPRAIALPCR